MQEWNLREGMGLQDLRSRVHFQRREFYCLYTSLQSSLTVKASIDRTVQTQTPVVGACSGPIIMLLRLY